MGGGTEGWNVKQPTASQLRREIEDRRQTLGIGSKAWAEYLEEGYGHRAVTLLGMWQLRDLQGRLEAKFQTMLRLEKEAEDARRQREVAEGHPQAGVPFIFRR